jgi:hypothetical protein
MTEWIINKLKGKWNGMVMAYFKTSQPMPGGTEENYETMRNSL